MLVVLNVLLFLDENDASTSVSSTEAKAATTMGPCRVNEQEDKWTRRSALSSKRQVEVKRRTRDATNLSERREGGGECRGLRAQLGAEGLDSDSEGLEGQGYLGLEGWLGSERGID